jgi:hypothetical protein
MKKIVSCNAAMMILLFVILIPLKNWAQVTLPYSQNFEGSTSEWTLQSSSPNKWVVGTAAKNGGSKGLYISNNNGTSNAYTDSPNVSGYSQTYASFQVNLTGITNAELKFDWRAIGEQYFDYGDVWINTGGSDILISYTDPSESSYGEFCSFDPYTNINSNPTNVFVNKTISLTSYVGGIVTIKFRWRNDDSSVNNPPFAIDNVEINAIAAPVIAPTIAWQSIGSLTSTSASISSNISNAGTNAITARGLVYGTSPNPTTANSVVTSGSGTGVYSVNLTGLNFQTHYYFRPYCTTNAGTYYGSQGDFYTLNISAPVANSASSIGSSGFTANWGSAALATGYKLDVSTSATVFTNYVAQSSFVTFDFENGEQLSVNTSLSNSNNAGTYFNTSSGVMNYANEPGNGGEVKKVTGWDDGVNTKYYRVDFNSQGMYSMKLSSKQRSTSDGPKNFKIQYSIGQNGSENWIDITGGTITCADNFTTGAVSNLTLPVAMENLSVVSLRWVVTSTIAVNNSTLTSAGENNIDDIIIKGSSAQTLVSGYDNLTVSGTSKAVTGLSPSTNYYYRVRSTATGAVSGNSNVISVSTTYVPCAPTQQPTNLQIYGYLNAATGINVTFSPVSPAPSGYLVVRYPHNATPTAPVNETTYTAGSTLGLGTVIYAGASNTAATTTGLTPNTIYDFYIYAYNVTGSCPINYNVTSPLSGSKQTCVTASTANSGSSITTSGFTANWSSVANATGYLVSVYSDSNLTNYVTGYPAIVSTVTSLAVTGLSYGDYYYTISAIGAEDCSSPVSNTIGPINLNCATPTSIASTTSVTGTTSSSISAEFTAASVTPTGYLVVRTTSNTQPIPVTGTTYNVGSNAIGYIEYNYTSVGSWTSSGLTANATYYYWVFSYINGNCTGGPVYSSSAASFNENANQVNTWTGTVSDSWNTGGNWSTGAVPTSTDNIVIDSNATNGTVLDTNFTVTAGQKLTLSGTGTLTINPTSILTIAGYADFGGKLVTIKSTSAGTATLGQVTGTLTGATNVTVERYIPAKRAWRAITAPLKGWNNSSVYSTWMNNNQSGVSDAIGMLVFGPTTSWGIQMAPNYNLLTYNANNTWSGVSMPIASGTLFSSTINNAFMAFITGPFGSSNIASGATATTLKANGTLITGSQTYSSLSSTEYSFIGNPYASPISPSAALADNSNFSNIWVWDPQLASHGAYVVYSGSAYSNVSGSYTAGQPIQSGQAFFLKPNTTSNFILSESHKSTTVDNGLFDRTAASAKILRVNLLKQIENNWHPFDAVMTLFHANATNAIDVLDAVKMFNSNNNITLQNSGVSLMAEHRALPVVQDVLQLRVNDTQTGANYKLAIQTEDFSAVDLTARLEDLVTNTSVPVALNGTVTEYTFVPSLIENIADRFRIVFGTQLSNDAFDSNAINVFPNPVKGSSFQIQLPNPTIGNYKYAIINTLGQVVDQGKINPTDQVNYTVTLKNSLQSGIYILNVIDEQNKAYSVKLIKQ